MAAKTTLNAKNLETLGATRLSELLIEISMGSAASKRRLRLELAGAQSAAEVAREVRKRLSSIDRSRTIVNWRKIKALKSDLETQRTVIATTIANSDPDEAMELLWRFLGLAESIFARCEDGNGRIIESFHAACVDLGIVAEKTSGNPRLAEQAFAAIQRNDHGEYDPLIPALAPALGKAGLERLKLLLANWAEEPVEKPAERVVMAWGSGGPTYEDELGGRQRHLTIRMALQEIADAQGDVDAFIAQQSKEARMVPTIAAEIALRLLAAGRPKEALVAVDKAEVSGRTIVNLTWQKARVAVLEALGRNDEAQAFRWQCFERELSVEHLQAFIKRLPDFDDMEAERKAFGYVRVFRDVHAALRFFAAWPMPSEASGLVLARAEEIDGDLYEILTPMAEWLQEKYPLAATILLRAMIGFALERGRAGRYRHVARHLNECAALVRTIGDFGDLPDHERYVAGLKKSHGKKHGFWSAVA